MSSWKDQMRAATFRGVPFFLDSSDRTSGRRVVKHEYPFKDKPFTEDMGRKGKSFTLEGFVLGDDYFSARDSLLTALEASGPGVLDHPFFGRLTVVVSNYRVRETADKGRSAAFSVDFDETSTPVQPTAVIDAAAAVKVSAQATRDAAGVDFLTKYLGSAVLTSSVSTQLRNMTTALDSGLRVVDMEEQTLASVKARVATFQSSVSALVNAPSDMLASVADLLGLVPKSLLMVLYAFDPGDRPPSTTTNNIAAQVNFDAVRRMIQRLALCNAAELTLSETFDSFETAVVARNALTALVDDQAENSTDDVYPELLQLRADLVKAVPGDSSDLPHLLPVTPPSTVPSLVLAYSLYGDVDGDLDLVARNRVAHPGFVIGGRQLQVLSRG